MEGAVIEIILILSGFALMGLGLLKLKEYRAGYGDFAPHETDGLDVWWRRAAQLRRFNHHLDLWIFLILGPAAVALGIYAMLK